MQEYKHYLNLWCNICFCESKPWSFYAQAKAGLLRVDEKVDEIMNYLHKNNLAHCINLMIVSDHGAAPVSCSDNFHLETFISNIEAIAHVYTGAVGRLRTKDSKVQSKLLGSEPHKKLLLIHIYIRSCISAIHASFRAGNMW